MNWNKIKQSCPKSFELLLQSKEPMMDYLFLDDTFLYWIASGRIVCNYNDRDLYDFFEKEHEIYINIEPVFSGKMTARYMRFSGFQIEVTYIDTSGRLIQIYDDELDELITDRTKVESIAFEYCFQVSERRLTKNK